MNKTWLIFKHELITTVTRRSFIITLMVGPLISLIAFLVISILGENASQAVTGLITAPVTQTAEGYVDHSDLIKGLPTGVDAQALLAFSDEEQARQALTDGEIIGYYVVPADYIDTGDVVYIRHDYNPMSGLDQSGTFRYVLSYNLLGQDQTMVDRLNAPFKLNVELLSPSTERDQDNALSFIVPYAVTMLFYIVIMASAGFMLNSITTEKQNRVMEILMVSITPMQMLTGKILALGIVGLLQTLVWSGTGMLFLQLSGKPLNLPAGYQLPLSFLFWGMVFFLLGYGLYASLMAGVGALVPNLKEASQATTVMIIPLVIPLALINALIEEPNGGLATVLSLFPLTAPVSMMTRLAAADVPIWQLIVAAVLLIATTAVIIRSVAGMFRAQTLLSGQGFNLVRFMKAMAGKTIG